MSDSFLLDAVELTTSAWVKRFSLVALPPLRMSAGRSPRAIQRRRDTFILAMLSVSAGMVILFHLAQADGAHFWTVAIAAAAFYRCLDISITLVRTGTFLSFRGDVQLNEEPTWRVQRILLGVLINYVELILWFSIIYRQFSLTSACQFAEPITSMDQAFNLSFSNNWVRQIWTEWYRFGLDRLLAGANRHDPARACGGVDCGADHRV